MVPRLSSVLASAGLVGAVPGGLLVAFGGYSYGLFPYRAIPFVAVGFSLVVMAVLWIVLPPLRRRELAD